MVGHLLTKGVATVICYSESLIVQFEFTNIRCPLIRLRRRQQSLKCLAPRRYLHTERQLGEFWARLGWFPSLAPIQLKDRY